MKLKQSVRKRDTQTEAPLSSNTIMYTLPFEIIGFPHNIQSVNVDVLSLNHSNVDCLFYDALSTLICCFINEIVSSEFSIIAYVTTMAFLITMNLEAFSYQMRCIFSPSVIPLKMFFFLLLNLLIMAKHQRTIDCSSLKKKKEKKDFFSASLFFRFKISHN